MNSKLKIFAGFGIIVAVVVIFTFMTFQNIQENEKNITWISHTHEVIYSLQELEIAAANLKTAQETFIRTGKEDLLRQFMDFIGESEYLVNDTMRLIADNPAQIEKLEKIESLLEILADRFLEAGRARIMYETGEIPEEDYLLIAGNEPGKKEYIDIEITLDELEVTELRLLDMRQDEMIKRTRTILSTMIIGLLLTAIIGLVLAIFVSAGLKKGVLENGTNTVTTTQSYSDDDFTLDVKINASGKESALGSVKNLVEKINQSISESKKQ